MTDKEKIADLEARELESVAAESQVAALTASLAELRKRMENWRARLAEFAREDPDGVECAVINGIDECLASPPSPAPVESKPKEGA